MLHLAQVSARPANPARFRLRRLIPKDSEPAPQGLSVRGRPWLAKFQKIQPDRGRFGPQRHHLAIRAIRGDFFLSPAESLHPRSIDASVGTEAFRIPALIGANPRLG